MSGGVDSSVAAKLLTEKDYDLSAVFMRNWDTRDESGTDTGCEWEKDWEDVQRVCRTLDIPHRMVDLSREYWLRVFEPSLRAWEAGDTPNPDIWCNKEVKFGALLSHLAGLTPFLATGHYALKDHDAITGRPKLLRPLDRTKDQSYYLSSIPESSLARTLFPLSNLRKDDVRRIAQQAGLSTASRAESMGICFVGEKRRFSSFLANYLPPRPGVFRHLTSGRVLGAHQGLWTYTIGENARIAGQPERLFVVRKDKAANELIVAPSSSSALLSTGLLTHDFAWIWADAPPAGLDAPGGLRMHVQYRYRSPAIACTVRHADDGALHIAFDEPQKAVARGQIAALYDGMWCLGCGTIDDIVEAPEG
ncbi:tRNA methyltransferase [Vararia minispora EC-137]|uniref:tRNA methyltransferase n=1 Tax=Vararia minispora EC-137 TaxID=1314806 RepID=A0ACB8QQU7_9AGAM|nr:tRNA methyltransferase [Vararia minispora EC-137]